MKNLLVKLFLLLKIDILISRIYSLSQSMEIKRIEKKCGCKINYIEQGFKGIKIMSSNGDFSRFKIDSTSHLKSDTVIECSGGVYIGRYFHTGRGLTVFSTNHNYDSQIAIPYDSVDLIEPVVIKDFVWCGANVTIVPGVTIGEGVVIGSGTVVTKNVPDFAVIGGNPHRIIKFRDVDTFKRLKNNGQFY